MGFVAALDEEIAALEASLRADRRFIKLEELRRVRALYSDDGTFKTFFDATKAFSANLGAKASAGSPGRPKSPDRERALQAAKGLLRGRTSPTLTADILAHLKDIGIEFGGKDPLSNLSTLLYRSKQFQSHARNGWTLKNEEAADASPGQEPSAASEYQPQSEPVEPALGGGT